MTEEGSDEEGEKQESGQKKDKQGEIKESDSLDQIVKPKRRRRRLARKKTEFRIGNKGLL